MSTQPHSLEQEALNFLSEDKLEQAFKLFRRAALGYKEAGNYKQSAICFASAASCWAKKSGEKTFSNSATTYEEAAQQAEKCFDLSYAFRLYKLAAINYERDGEFLSYSDCYYRSKECFRRFLTYSIFIPNKLNSITKNPEPKGVTGIIKKIFLWIVLTFSFLVWGHGERPLRTLFSGISVVLICAFLYTFGFIVQDGVNIRPDFFQSLYFSVITFTTVGYGDFTPAGLSKAVAVVEAFSGIFVVPLFIIGLSRKYLRV